MNFNKHKNVNIVEKLSLFVEKIQYGIQKICIKPTEKNEIKYLDNTKLISFEENKDVVECKLSIKNKNSS